MNDENFKKISDFDKSDSQCLVQVTGFSVDQLKQKAAEANQERTYEPNSKYKFEKDCRDLTTAWFELNKSEIQNRIIKSIQNYKNPASFSLRSKSNHRSAVYRRNYSHIKSMYKFHRSVQFQFGMMIEFGFMELSDFNFNGWKEVCKERIPYLQAVAKSCLEELCEGFEVDFPSIDLVTFRW